MPLPTDTNLVLIGMPGVGKSTVGVLLAKTLARDFLDTDLHIQFREGRPLQTILDTEGPDAFRAIEERHILALDRRGCVIATGGSVVYSNTAVEHLRASGIVVHLHLSLPLLERRLAETPARGILIRDGQTLAALYQEREPLYLHYAHLTVDCGDRSHDQLARDIAARIREQPSS